MKKSLKVLISILSVMLVMAFMPGTAFAGSEQDVAKITFSAATPDSFIMVEKELEVKGDLFETYYPDLAEHDMASGVSLADVLVAAHIEKYGADFTKEKASEYLNFKYAEGYTWEGVEYPGYIMVNGKEFGIDAGGWYTFFNNGASTTSVDSAAVKSGDAVLAAIGDAVNGGLHSGFDKADYTAKAGEKIAVAVTADDGMGTTSVPKDVKVYTVDKASGAMTEIPSTEKDGKYEISFDKAGTYLISAKGTAEAYGMTQPILGALAKVNVPAEVTFSAATPDSFIMVEKELEVKGDLFETYYPDLAQYDKANGISLADTLVAAHIEKYGADFTKEKASEYLNFKYAEGYTWEGVDYPGYIMVNGKEFGIDAGGWYTFFNNGASTTSVDSTEVKSGDAILAAIGDAVNGGLHSGFDKAAYTAKTGEKIAVAVTADDGMGTTSVPKDVKIFAVDKASGAMTEIPSTEKDGKYEISFAKAGTYLISAKGTAEAYGMTQPILGALAKVTVTAPAAVKKANPMTAKGNTVKLKVKKLKKKAQTVKKAKAFTVKKNQGKVTFKKVKGNKKITVGKLGKVTVKKGLKKGTYKVTVKVTAAGNANYKAKSKNVTLTIKVVK